MARPRVALASSLVEGERADSEPGGQDGHHADHDHHEGAQRVGTEYPPRAKCRRVSDHPDGQQHAEDQDGAVGHHSRPPGQPVPRCHADDDAAQ